MPKDRTEATYASWRATVPWSDAAIAEALEAEAAARRTLHQRKWAEIFAWRAAHLRRTGRLSMAMLREVLPRLVTTCALCARPAHYRIGLAGRCRQHRDVTTPGQAARQARFEQRSSAMAAARKAGDYRDLAQASLQGLGRPHGRGGPPRWSKKR